MSILSWLSRQPKDPPHAAEVKLALEQATSARERFEAELARNDFLRDFLHDTKRKGGRKND